MIRPYHEPGEREETEVERLRRQHIDDADPVHALEARERLFRSALFTVAASCAGVVLAHILMAMMGLR